MERQIIIQQLLQDLESLPDVYIKKIYQIIHQMQLEHSKETVDEDFDWEKFEDEIFSLRRKNNLDAAKRVDNLFLD